MLPTCVGSDAILLTEAEEYGAREGYPGEPAPTVVELASSAGWLGGRVATEHLQFAGAMVLMLGILIGSYWFVYVPNRIDSSGEARERTQQ
jgi:hypothetical protein